MEGVRALVWVRDQLDKYRTGCRCRFSFLVFQILDFFHPVAGLDISSSPFELQYVRCFVVFPVENLTKNRIMSCASYCNNVDYALGGRLCSSEQTKESIMRYLVYETGVGKTANMEVFDHLVGLPTHPGMYRREAGTAHVPSLSFGERLQLLHIFAKNGGEV